MLTLGNVNFSVAIQDRQLKIRWIKESKTIIIKEDHGNKPSSGFCLIFTIVFLLFLAPIKSYCENTTKPAFSYKQSRTVWQNNFSLF